ncbi:MAG: hypothetical protein LLF97_13195 [Planctomycetaceae bacterium]|nr:hypothetical protein [Planctomycetaceae bacterium]
MKVKIKFDQKVLLDLLLQHVEKIVLGVFVLIFLLMVYRSLGSAGRFGKSPAQLQSQAANSRREIEATPAPAGLVSVDYAAEASRSRIPVAAQPYATPTVWDPSVFATRQRRGEPPLLAVLKLRGAAGLGPFRTAGEHGRSDSAGQDETKGERWIVLTGLVPLEQQEQAFYDAFRTSIHYDQQKDAPVYYGYWVERVEVPDGSTAEPDWSKAEKFVSKEATDKALQQWGGSAQNADLVASQYLVPDFRLAFPLGPLARRDWDASVAHEPEIPLIRANSETEIQPAPESTTNERRSQTTKSGPDSPFGVLDGQHGDRRAPEVVERVQTEDNRTPPYRLFRFFDFSIEPGKQYRYRVRLALANPNYGVRTSMLAKPELAESPIVTTGWSEPTPVIASPRDLRILAVSVKPAAARPGSEPSGQILISRWLEKSGDEVFKEFTVGRGQVADFSGVEATVTVLGTNEKADLVTGSVVVDMRGGQRFGKRRDAPTSLGQILILNAAGLLSVHDEADDLSLYKQITTVPKERVAEARGLDEETGGAKPAKKSRAKRTTTFSDP